MFQEADDKLFSHVLANDVLANDNMCLFDY